jgi:hypothetical protein
MKRLVLLSATGLASLVASAHAQTTLFTTTGSSTTDQLGKAVAGVGDVNQDGWGDYAVGIPYSDVGGLDTGSVRVISGRNGQILYTFNGVATGDRLGESVAGAGDLNGDGYADIIAGGPLNGHNGVNAGMARVWSGRDGSVLYTWYGDQPGDWFGKSVDAAGDVNGDGHPDVIVGAPYGKGTVLSNVGEARVFSGLNGSVIRTFNSTNGVEVFGTSVSGAGDVDKDGWDDVIIGAPQYTNGTLHDAGRAYVLSGRTGNVIWSWAGVSSGENYAICVDGGRDANNDGWPDLVVGSPFSDSNMGNAGSVYVYSGRNGAQLQWFKGLHGGDELGRSCAFAGDVDGDGWADVIGGARLNDQVAVDAGMARVWSGRTGASLFTFYGSQIGEFFGHAVACAGDIDGDGLDDVIVGWPSADYAGVDAGRARVWTGTPLAVTSYCTATTNTAGCAATITTTGSPSATNPTPFNVRATQVLNQKTGLLFYGRHGEATPYLGGWLCVEPPFKRTWVQNSGGSGSGTSCTGTLVLDMNGWVQGQNDLTLGSGDTVYAQYWYRDTASPSGVAYTNAVLFTILP